MKIFYYTWNENSAVDMLDSLGAMGHEVVRCSLPLTNYEEDDCFAEEVEKIFREEGCEIFLSFNYFPLLAKTAAALKKKYIAWVYDMPHYTLYSPSVRSPYVYLFLFDRVQFEQMQAIKEEHVYHMPLAVNTRRLNHLLGKDIERVTYQQDVSFVGSLYENNLYRQIQYLPDILKGYLDGIIDAQEKVYGYNFIAEALDDTIIEQMNQFVFLNLDTSYLWNERLVYTDMLNAEVTHRERVKLLKAVNEKFDFKLFSASLSDELPKRVFHGIVSYETQMPKVFRESKINLNISLRSITSGIPLRAVDIMGAGGFLLSNYQPELAEYFIDGEDMVLFESCEDMLEKIAYYLEHEEERKQIAYSGWKKVQELYSYEHKLKQIFEISMGK